MALDHPKSIALSDDQAGIYDRLADVFLSAGVDLADAVLIPPGSEKQATVAVLGKAGSGKTLLLAEIVSALSAAGVDAISADYESRKARENRSFAVLAPTNKAASVLQNRGVPATTIHRILYTPVYDPEYEAIAEWLEGNEERPDVEGLTDTALDRAAAFYKDHKSMPGALAAAGLRGSDFIKGWTRREDPLDIGLIDEASMLDNSQLDDLREIFSTLVLFGDPAQLAPVGQSGEMAFATLPDDKQMTLSRIHRQAADNPILDLAYALSDEDVSYPEFDRLVHKLAADDDRVVIAPSVDADIMARSPVLVWMNKTRIRLIHAWRNAVSAPQDDLLEGEPLICDGIELPMKHRKKRIDLEARGLIKGAQCVYLGPGRKAGFARLHVLGAPDPQVSAASIIQIEAPDLEEPFIPSAARMGATFLHGAAVTIHKAQGSQWPDVQVFAPDIEVAARIGRMEAGIPLWKRLTYVAITRAENRLIWVTRARLAKPKAPLSTSDLSGIGGKPLTLEAENPD